VTVLAGIAGVFAAALSGNSGPAPRSSAHGAGAGQVRSRRTRAPLGASLSPALTGGVYGWCLTVEGGGTCPNVPTADGPLAGAMTATEPRAQREVITFLLPPEVAGVLVNGRRLRAVTVPGDLPYHLRVARVTLPRPGTPVAPAGHNPAPPGPPTPQSILAINAQGVVLHPRSNPEREAAPDRISWWESAHPAPAGPCRIRAHGMSALAPKWGHVAAEIHRYPGRIIGRAFFSCIDTEYYLHDWPLDAAILLDAEHPGRPPAPIPGMKPVPHTLGLFNAPGDFHGDITAVRHGDAWLVVAGGSGLPQRIEVLRHLTATISLG